MNTLKPVLNFYKDKGGETAWCQQFIAIDSKGLPVSEFSCEAKQWCLTGAVRAAWCQQFMAINALIKVFSELHARVGNNIFSWNDASWCTYEKVKTILSQDDVLTHSGETREHYEQIATSTINGPEQ